MKRIKGSRYEFCKMLRILAFILMLSGIIIFHSTINRDISIAVTGDILLDRGVKTVIDREGMDYPYLDVRQILKESDIVFGNLECPLTTADTPVLKDRNLIFRASPDNAMHLSDAGYTILNLANNHSMDYGYEGLAGTLDALKKNRIMAVGAGNDKSEAERPVYIIKKGVKIGFLGFSEFLPEGYFYFEHRPNIAHIDSEYLADRISEAKEACDILIVSFHWGKEFDFYTGKQQRMWAHTAIDNGADMVVGHHPHVLQGIEEYRNKIILYSLGNFIFDSQMPSETDKSVIANIIIHRSKITKIELIPVKLRNSKPMLLRGEDADYVLARLLLYSKDFPVDIKIIEDKGYIIPGT